MDQKNEYTKEYLEKEVIGQIKGITIPMNISISGEQRIMELKELERIINSSFKLAQTVCACRKRMDNCENPRDGCIALDEYAEEWIEKDRGKEISKEDALKALGQAVEYGLVHIAYVREREKADIICSCCSCCCDSLSAMLRFGYSDQVMSSTMIAFQDNEKCTSCGACADRCHFEARMIAQGRLFFNEARCAGCGVCLPTCPSGAIQMKERKSGGAIVPFP
jgi:Pyruvate/2-oxoacid:ferredoxin oxidoreductase delta subunit